MLRTFALLSLLLACAAGCDDASYSSAAAVPDPAPDSDPAPQGTDARPGEGDDRTPAPPRPAPDEPPAPAQYSSLHAGAGGFCALTIQGEPHCWGGPAAAQYASALGAGPFASLDIGVAMHWGGYGFADVACGIRPDGALHCGSILGDAIAPATELHRALEGKRVLSVATHKFTTCAAVEDEGVFCWVPPRLSGFPQPERAGVYPITNTAGIVSLMANIGETCGLDAEGGLRCWYQDYTHAQRRRPELRFRAITRGSEAVPSSHICGLTFDNRLVCLAGDLPDTVREETLPADADIASIAATNDDFCAVATDGRAYCWGRATSGELGIGAVAPDAQPRASRTLSAVATQERFTTVLPIQRVDYPGGTVETSQTCGLTVKGQVLCWGRQMSSEASWVHGGPLVDWQPARVEGLPAIRDVHLGGGFACALDSDGQTYCWGDNRLGQISSDPTQPLYAAPLHRTDLPRFVALSGGIATTCGRTAQGAWFCWGGFDAVQLDGLDGEPYASLSMSHIAGGCGVTRSGRVACDNAHNLTYLPSELEVPAPMAQVQVVNRDSACGVSQEGAVVCWGKYFGGGTMARPAMFVRVDTGPEPAVRLVEYNAAGWEPSVTCAVAASGALHCWSALLGQPGRDIQATPVVNPAGTDHLLILGQKLCARSTEGERYCAEFYIGPREPATPVTLEATPDEHRLPTGRWTEVAGLLCTHDRGDLACSGLDNHGQLGRGTAIVFDTPTALRVR
jgi:hypothetical protein